MVCSVLFCLVLLSCSAEPMTGWSQPLMGGHMMPQQLPDQSAFSQHQVMERDDTGIVAPANTFHQSVPTSYMDFPKVRVQS